MKQLEQAEKSIGNLLKDLPPLSAAGKKGIVGIMPWLALIFGVLQVVAAFFVWGLARTADRAADIVNTYAAYYPAAYVDTISGFDRTLIYLGAVTLLVQGVLGLLAYKHLVAKHRRGWELLFIASLINIAYAVLSIFIQGRGVGSFIFTLLGTFVGLYLLFQIKDAYTGKSTSAGPSAPKQV